LTDLERVFSFVVVEKGAIFSFLCCCSNFFCLNARFNFFCFNYLIEREDQKDPIDQFKKEDNFRTDFEQKMTTESKFFVCLIGKKR